jgi:alanine dehydrogenase
MTQLKTLLLSRSDVLSLVSMADAVPAVESAFAAHAEGRAQMPPKVYLDLHEFHGDLRAMPAYVDGAAGVKWVNSHPENPARFGLPSVMGMYILSDPATALPLAVMDATLLTAVRTGAAAAIASKYLAAKSPRTIGFVGCGVQARTLLAAHRVVYGHALEVLCADVSMEAAQRFAEESGGRVVTIEEASGCNIVNASTPARAPVVLHAWVRDGAHINAMGADAHGKQELDPAILLDARVVIDDWEQASHSGEINVPLSSGILRRDQIHATLGEIIAGRHPGREAARVTVFDSTGLAVQDVALAKVIHAAARERGTGTPFDFFG